MLVSARERPRRQSRKARLTRAPAGPAHSTAPGLPVERVQPAGLLPTFRQEQPAAAPRTGVAPRRGPRRPARPSAPRLSLRAPRAARRVSDRLRGRGPIHPARQAAARSTVERTVARPAVPHCEPQASVEPTAAAAPRPAAPVAARRRPAAKGPVRFPVSPRDWRTRRRVDRSSPRAPRQWLPAAGSRPHARCAHARPARVASGRVPWGSRSTIRQDDGRPADPSPG